MNRSVGRVLALSAAYTFALHPATAIALEYDSPDLGDNRFGSALAAQPIPSTGRQQLYVGDPGADIGAIDAGALYVFDDQSTALVARIQNPAPAESDNFAASVALWPKDTRGMIVVGCPGKDAVTTDAGCVYVLDAVTRALLRTIINPEPAQGDGFGRILTTFGQSASTGLVAVGVPSRQCAYVFDLSTGAYVRKLISPEAYAGERFGSSVYERDGKLFVGAFGNRTTSQGAAYAFDAYSGAFLFDLVGGFGDVEYGTSICSNGAVIAVGDPLLYVVVPPRLQQSAITYLYDATTRELLTAILPKSGVSYPLIRGPQLGKSICEINRSFAIGDPFVSNVRTVHGGSLEVTDIQDPHGDPGFPYATHLFGAALCPAGTRLLVGEPGVWQYAGIELTFRGKAHLLPCPSADPPATPTGVHAEVISNAQVRITWNDVAWDRGYRIFRKTNTTAFELFGTVGQNATEFVDNSVRPLTQYLYTVQAFNLLDASAQSAVVGATTPGLPAKMRRMIADPAPTTADWFGTALATLSGNVVVGAPGHDSAFAVDSGEAYLISASTGARLKTYSPPTPQAAAWFGMSVAASPYYVAIGAPFEDSTVQDEGAVYIFSGYTGKFVRRIANPSPVAGDHFGFSLAMRGTTLAIGKPGSLDVDGGGKIYLANLAYGRITQTIPGDGGAQGLAFTSWGNIGSVDPGPTHSPGTVYRFGSRGNSLGSRPDGFSIAGTGANFLVGTVHRTITSGWFAYLLNGTNGDIIRFFTNPEFDASDQFGFAVAADGLSALVSAPADHHAAGGGAYFVFDSNKSTLKTRVDNPTPNPGDRFGYAIAPSPYGIFVGAPGDCWNGPATGTVFLMMR